MAEMIPERIPTKASKGEARMFAALAKLPDDCVAYYEPLINRRNPDFIVIIPQFGVLILRSKAGIRQQSSRPTKIKLLFGLTMATKRRIIIQTFRPETTSFD